MQGLFRNSEESRVVADFEMYPGDELDFLHPRPIIVNVTNIYPNGLPPFLTVGLCLVEYRGTDSITRLPSLHVRYGHMGYIWVPQIENWVWVLFIDMSLSQTRFVVDQTAGIRVVRQDQTARYRVPEYLNVRCADVDGSGCPKFVVIP